MKILLLFLISTLAGEFVHAAENTRPANFDYPEDKRRIDKLIVFPEVKGKVAVMLNCVSQIKTSGKMSNTGCYMKDQYDRPYAEALAKAAKKARLNPAMIDGKEKEIYLQFRVEFVAEDEEKNIFFHLNPGYEENVKAYGYDHIAGQRVIRKKEPWIEACPKRAKYLLWVRAYLGEDGRAESPSLEYANGIVPTAECQKAIGNTILASQFVPAMADGMPVPSTFIEQFGN